MKNKKLAQTAILASLAIIFGYIESLFPLPIPVYGVKVGISNGVILAAIYMLNTPAAWGIMLIKTVCSSLLFSGFSAFLYSVSGGILSLFVMCFLKKSGKFSIMGISIAGGAFHNIGQLICARLIFSSISVLYYLPILILCGILSGAVIGEVTKLILRRLRKYLDFKDEIC